jgi:hypothetical protein
MLMGVIRLRTKPEGEVQLNLVVQGYLAQLIAQFQKSVINRFGSSSPEPHAL